MIDPAPSIATFLAAAAAVLSTLPGVMTADVGRGRFTRDELASSSFAAPALRVAAGAVQSNVNAGDGSRDLIVRTGVAIITRDGREGARERVAVDLLDRLMVLLPTNPWGLDWAGAPEAIGAVNAYSGTIGRAGVMVWEVGFDQPLRVGHPHPLMAPVIEGASIPPQVDITHRGRTIEAVTWKADDGDAE